MTASLEERYALGLKSAPKADAPQALTGRSSKPEGLLLIIVSGFQEPNAFYKSPQYILSSQKSG